MDALLQECLDARPVAVVGASNNPSKYGNIIYRDLKRRGWNVYPVHPALDTVDGDPVYKSVANCPETPGLAVFVIPAEIGLKVAEVAKAAGIERIWLQPGADSPALIARITELGLKLVHHECIMVLAHHSTR